jgi:GNAT superfamily N-acetyltransferase
VGIPLAIGAAAALAALCEFRAKGSRARLEAILEKARKYKIYANVESDRAAAFREVAGETLGWDYSGFLSIDEESYGEESDLDVGIDAEVDRKILQVWEQVFGVMDGPVLVWHMLNVEESFRGVGLGSSLVRRVEEHARGIGAKAIILHAADISDRHSIGFWRNLGYREWPGEYYDWLDQDRFMVKVLQ